MENLADDIQYQLHELSKCEDSFEYFVDKYCWIENKQTQEAIPFKLWPEQKRIVPYIVACLRLLILKARQLGLTWMVAAYCLWKVTFFRLQLIVVISAKEDWAVEFLDRVKFIRQRLPEWMLPTMLKDTTEQLVYSHGGLNSTIKSLPTTPEGAQSKTPTLLVIDESALNRYIKKIFASSKPGLDVAKGQMIIISNSIKTGPGWSFTRGLYTKAMAGLNDFKRIFLSWKAHPDRGPNFIKEQLKEGMDEDDISQHYPATEQEAISTLLGSYFGKVLARHTHTLEGIKGYFAVDIHKEVIFKPDPKGIVTIWHYPYHLEEHWDGLYWKDIHAIGSDVSEGLGQSSSVAYVMNRRFDRFDCRIRSNRIDAYQWATQLVLASRYYKNADRDAIICPERTGAGITTCERLKELNHGNLYLRLIPGKVGQPPTKEIGWAETAQGKHDLCQDLKTWLRTMKGTLYCAILLDECSTYIRHDTGKLDPEEGKLGDCVIAAGCTIQASHFIGAGAKTVKVPQKGWRKRFDEGRL